VRPLSPSDASHSIASLATLLLAHRPSLLPPLLLWRTELKRRSLPSDRSQQITRTPTATTRSTRTTVRPFHSSRSFSSTPLARIPFLMPGGRSLYLCLLPIQALPKAATAATPSRAPTRWAAPTLAPAASSAAGPTTTAAPRPRPATAMPTTRPLTAKASAPRLGASTAAASRARARASRCARRRRPALDTVSPRPSLARGPRAVLCDLVD
jgi:hypothetical protein